MFGPNFKAAVASVWITVLTSISLYERCDLGSFMDYYYSAHCTFPLLSNAMITKPNEDRQLDFRTNPLDTIRNGDGDTLIIDPRHHRPSNLMGIGSEGEHHHIVDSGSQSASLNTGVVQEPCGCNVW
jgi:hypothetical protein